MDENNRMKGRLCRILIYVPVDFLISTLSNDISNLLKSPFSPLNIF